jgi:hypothetical protein
MDRGLVAYNQSGLNGGGVAYSPDSAGSSSLINSIFNRNRAARPGTALYLADSAGGTMDIAYTTIVGSDGDTAIYASQGGLNLLNTIFAGHSTDLEVAGAATVNEDYALFDQPPVFVGVVNSGGNSLVGDPAFVNPAGDDYHLTLLSAAINRAVDTGVIIDYDGIRRPDGDGFDIGAYEYGSARIYLPLTQQDRRLAPDLIVSDLIVSNSAITVVVQNIGNGLVLNEFWVDLYVDPVPPPTGVNEVWDDGRSEQGIVWGVTEAALPALTSGGVLTLTLDGPYYRSDISNFTGIITGSTLYVQVDAANTLTTYGGVLEIHEVTGDPYNNILGPIVFTANMTLESEKPVIETEKLPLNGLPLRPDRSALPLSLPQPNGPIEGIEPESAPLLEGH